jgi:ABC-2 type transport system ATP-binding protein
MDPTTADAADALVDAREALVVAREALVVAREALVVDGVTQRFGDRTVLDQVSLEVPPGRVVGLLGPNGAGKTTLMRIIFGVIGADAGSVRFQNRPVGPVERRSWGYMPQERGLYDEMRVIDLLVWFARLHGLTKPDARRNAHDLLDRLGLADRSRDPVRDLSGGMAQRVQLAAAMVHEPPLLVLDEPFAGLDPVAVRFLSTVVQDHVRAGGHLLLSSHQLDLVEDMCETITLIHQGRVVLQGDVAALKAASTDRFLRVDVPVDPAWLAAVPAEVVERTTAGTRLRLEPRADAVGVLKQISSRASVRDFGVEAPTLSELFLAATGEPTHAEEAVIDLREHRTDDRVAS